MGAFPAGVAVMPLVVEHGLLTPTPDPLVDVDFLMSKPTSRHEGHASALVDWATNWQANPTIPLPSRRRRSRSRHGDVPSRGFVAKYVEEIWWHAALCRHIEAKEG
ncbi:hypothetical protein GGR50DRAFT_695726 [Xylaria sp. CBS 124048]|nr:hypothetical protein GGR50DRAFT_695726 [Xylaria sp. CBS 124048]